ncbi:Rieske 2Fe-2S domain-containing protein [Streptomyces sp. NPDC093018]|uniref:Rieske 2Fe-2S domain-containing protein n=1 Tax=Streptomyces sp. NPDC093018 TaxID=3155067 RepID=UPI00341F35F5
MGATTGTWHKAMDIDDLWEGDMAAAEVEHTKLLLVNVGGEIRAYQNRCPHQAWALDEGDFDGETLVCTRHMWEFDAKTGQGVNPSSCRLTSYPCRVGEDGAIMVDVG